jgi:hypothetical protein
MYVAAKLPVQSASLLVPCAGAEAGKHGLALWQVIIDYLCLQYGRSTSNRVSMHAAASCVKSAGMLAQAVSIAARDYGHPDTHRHNRMARQLHVCLLLQRWLCRHGDRLLQLQCGTSLHAEVASSATSHFWSCCCGGCALDHLHCCCCSTGDYAMQSRLKPYCYILSVLA